MFKTGNLVGPDLIQAPFEAFRQRRGPPGRNCGSQQTLRQQKPISRWPMKPRNLPMCYTGLARPGARLQRGAAKRCPPTEVQMFSVIKLTLNILWRMFATREPHGESAEKVSRRNHGSLGGRAQDGEGASRSLLVWSYTEHVSPEISVRHHYWISQFQKWMNISQ